MNTDKEIQVYIITMINVNLYFCVINDINDDISSLSFWLQHQ